MFQVRRGGDRMHLLSLLPVVLGVLASSTSASPLTRALARPPGTLQRPAWGLTMDSHMDNSLDFPTSIYKQVSSLIPMFFFLPFINYIHDNEKKYYQKKHAAILHENVLSSNGASVKFTLTLFKLFTLDFRANYC